MAGIIALTIEKGLIRTKINLEGLNPMELSMVSAQLRIMEKTILNEIYRLTKSP